MPISYTHALQFADGTDTGSAAANAAYNDLATATYGFLVRYNGATDLTLWAKGDSGTALYCSQIGGDGRADLIVQRSVAASIWRGPAITVDNTWRWVFFTLNRSTGVHTRIGGPKGGTMAAFSVTDINSGSGTVLTDAAQAFTIGANTIGQLGGRTIEHAFVGIWNSVLSVAQTQAVNDDLTAALQPVAAWKPDGSTTTSVANYISGPPAMTLSGTTTVTGPDTGGGGGIARGTRTLLSLMV